jgi:predicted dehydrogenase
MSFDHGSPRVLPVRFAVVGVGERGSAYARALSERRVEGAVLAAACDPEPARLAAFDPGVRATDLGAVEALRPDVWVIATPPSDHPAVLERAFAAGAHVLCEKPLATTAAEGRRLLDLHARVAADKVLAVALPLRTDPRYVALRALLRAGTVGEVRRVGWTVTDCLRTNAYYAARPWRARAGGGGGVLMNQCLHQLDLLIWLFGMPRRVRAEVGIGRHHPIEVEDDVTASFELDGGARGVLVASTGESPGCNRLEVAGTKARVVLESGVLEVTRNGRSTVEELREGPVRGPSSGEPTERTEVGTGGATAAALLSELVTAARDGKATTADAASGLRAVALAEAILISGAEARAVDVARELLVLPRKASPSRPDLTLADM